MASKDRDQFHYFTKLPPELQNRVWRNCVQEGWERQRFYELSNYEPEYNCLEITIDIKHILLRRECITLRRPILQVDQTSRKDNLRYYQLVQFSNRAVYMNMDVESIYFGSLPVRSSLHTFTADCRDPFWKTVKYLAWGMDQIDLILKTADPHIGLGFDGEFALQRFLKKLRQQFPALETFTLVLDGIEGELRRKIEHGEDEDGPVHFERSNAVLWPTDVCPAIEYHQKWIMFLKETWDVVADPMQNVPPLTINALQRGPQLRHPSWRRAWGYSHTRWSEWFHFMRVPEVVSDVDSDSIASESEWEPISEWEFIASESEGEEIEAHKKLPTSSGKFVSTSNNANPKVSTGPGPEPGEHYESSLLIESDWLEEMNFFCEGADDSESSSSL